MSKPQGPPADGQESAEPDRETLAVAALAEYPGAGGGALRRIIPVQLGENAILRVEPARSAPLTLRLHRGDGVERRTQIESELAWLDALRADLDLRVPHPLRTDRGEGVVPLRARNGPWRWASLLTWVEGEPTRSSGDPFWIRALGELVGALHQHASRWRPPHWFTRPTYAPERAFGIGTPLALTELASRLEPAASRRFEAGVARALAIARAEVESGRDLLLQHGDLHAGNLVRSEAGLGVIDFDDARIGPRWSDLMSCLLPWLERERWSSFEPPELRPFFAGYARHAPPPPVEPPRMWAFATLRLVSLLSWRQTPAARGTPAELRSLRERLRAALAGAPT